MELEQQIQAAGEVKLTKHAKKRINNRISLPESVVKGIVEDVKGLVFWDEKHETYIIQHNKTSVAVDVDEEEVRVATVHRLDNPHRYKNKGRFQRVQ